MNIDIQLKNYSESEITIKEVRRLQSRLKVHAQ